MAHLVGLFRPACVRWFGLGFFLVVFMVGKKKIKRECVALSPNTPVWGVYIAVAALRCWRVTTADPRAAGKGLSGIMRLPVIRGSHQGLFPPSPVLPDRGAAPRCGREMALLSNVSAAPRTPGSTPRPAQPAPRPGMEMRGVREERVRRCLASPPTQPTPHRVENPHK